MSSAAHLVGLGNGSRDWPTLDVPHVGLRPYPEIVDLPETLPAPQEHLPEVIRALLKEEEEGAVMVTTWAVVTEYLDEDGTPNVAAWCSADPPWRIGGLLTVAHDLLDASVFDEDAEEDDE